MELQDIIQEIKSNKQLIIAIDGPSGSLKTTLAKWFTDNFACSVFHCDDYFLPPERKTLTRLEEPGGNIDYERMEQEIFKNVTQEQISSHYFNCQTNVLEEREPTLISNVIIIEGVYSMHPRFIEYYDYTIFLDVPRDIQLMRILQRTNTHMVERFKNEWIPLEDRYFTAYDCKKQADVVIETSQNFRELLASIVL